ncbi:hypothetical protein Tco_0575279 [Tanacetum coccineum]
MRFAKLPPKSITKAQKHILAALDSTTHSDRRSEGGKPYSCLVLYPMLLEKLAISSSRIVEVDPTIVNQSTTTQILSCLTATVRQLCDKVHR